MADNELNGRFEELRQRWEQDPSSRIFTQLAEEYRRRGETLEAVKVLEEGLEHHPGSIAAQVSLGRCRLEAGLVEPALAALEAVVRKDPTQLVAYRLLVEAYVQQGDAASARERLEIYSQLNEQDPEVEVLEERIRSLEAAAPVPAEPPPSGPGPGVEGASHASSAAASPRAGGGDEHITVETPATGREESGSSGNGSIFRLPPSPHPAPNLFALVPRPLRRWQEAATAPASAVKEPSATPSQTPSAEAPAVAAPQPAASEVVPGPPVAPSPLSSPSSEAHGVEEEALAELQLDEDVATDEIDAPTALSPPPSTEPERPPAPPSPSPAPGASEPQASAPVTSPPETVDLEAQTQRLDVGPMRGESEGGSARLGEGPLGGRQLGGATSQDDTLTLAELYRRQGHTKDAEQIFRRVLDSDPDNPIAQTGLEQISAQRRGPANISSLLGDAAKPDAGVSEKKAAVLRNYLELLSDGSRDDVP